MINVFQLCCGAALAMSIVTFILFGADKLRSRRGAWRIPERVLLACAFLMGATGALAGMYMFRHKTRKLRFRILVPIFFIINIALICASLRCG